MESSLWINVTVVVVCKGALCVGMFPCVLHSVTATILSQAELFRCSAGWRWFLAVGVTLREQQGTLMHTDSTVVLWVAATHQ